VESAKLKAFLIHAADNVATLLGEGKEGDNCSVLGARRSSVVLKEGVPYGHKVAVRDIAQDEPIVKYAQTIGRATQPIPAGRCVHVHNIESLRGRGDLEVKR
jgi:altronate dehydratase small subunit